MTQTQKNYMVPALEKSIMILNALTEDELTISQIHTRLNIPKSSAFVILNTLEHYSLIEKSDDGKFRLGYGVFQLGMSFYQKLDIRRIARPHLEELVKNTPFTCHLAVLDHLTPIYIDKIEGDSFVRFSTAIGQQAPLLMSGVGKALASGLSDETIIGTIQVPLDTPTEKSRRSVDMILEDIQFVREHGFSIEDEEMEDGVRCIGAPIFGANGKIVASISITSLSKDLPAVKFHSIGNKVKETALSISKKLGYTAPEESGSLSSN